MPKEAKSKKYGHVAIILVILNSFIMGYLWGALGERGLWADATGTGGYTTNFELFLMGFVVVSAIVTISLWIKSVSK